MVSVSSALLVTLVFCFHAANATPGLPLSCTNSGLAYQGCKSHLSSIPTGRSECRAYLGKTVLPPSATTTLLRTRTVNLNKFRHETATTWTITTTSLPDITVMTTSTVVSTLMRRETPSGKTWSSTQLPPTESQYCCNMNVYSSACSGIGVRASTTTLNPSTRTVLAATTVTVTVKHTQTTTETLTATMTNSGTTDIITSFTTLPPVVPTSCGSASQQFVLKQTSGFMYFQTSDGSIYYGANNPYLTISPEGFYKVNSTIESAAVFIRNSDCSLASVDTGNNASITGPIQPFSLVKPSAANLFNVQLLVGFDSSNSTTLALASDPQRDVPSYWWLNSDDASLGSWFLPADDDGFDQSNIDAFNAELMTLTAEFLP